MFSFPKSFHSEMNYRKEQSIKDCSVYEPSQWAADTAPHATFLLPSRCTKHCNPTRPDYDCTPSKPGSTRHGLSVQLQLQRAGSVIQRSGHWALAALRPGNRRHRGDTPRKDTVCHGLGPNGKEGEGGWEQRLGGGRVDRMGRGRRFGSELQGNDGAEKIFSWIW